MLRRENFARAFWLVVEALIALFYPSNLSLHSQQDHAEGLVLGLTLGESNIFHFSPTDKKEGRTEVLLESGDLVLFRGMLWHGVDKIIPGTAQQWWKDMKVSCTEYSRKFQDVESSRKNLRRIWLVWNFEENSDRETETSERLRQYESTIQISICLW